MFSSHVSDVKDVLLGKSGNTSAGAQEQKSREGKGTKEFQDEDVYGPKNMNRWADIKEYDDDHDSQWFEEENERLGKDYITDIKSVFRKMYCKCFGV